MNSPRIQDIIQQRENQNIELKSSFNIQAIETIVAFSNTKGGKVYIGISDNGKLVEEFKVKKEDIPN